MKRSSEWMLRAEGVLITVVGNSISTFWTDSRLDAIGANALTCLGFAAWALVLRRKEVDA